MFTVHQYTKHSANPTAASGLHVYITPQYRNHGANKQTNRQATGKDNDLTVKQVFILQLGRTVAYPGILFGGGCSTNSVEDRGQREGGFGGNNPLVRGSGGSCNLVQKISFHIVKFS